MHATKQTRVTALEALELSHDLTLQDLWKKCPKKTCGWCLSSESCKGQPRGPYTLLQNLLFFLKRGEFPSLHTLWVLVLTAVQFVLEDHMYNWSQI